MLRKDIIMMEEDEKDYRNMNKICRFCAKENLIDKVGDHCQLTGAYRGSAHQSSRNNVKQKQNKFIPFVFHSSINYDCHLFFCKIS